MKIMFEGSEITLSEEQWATNFPSLCYRDVDNNPEFYLSWNLSRGFLFPEKDLPENGPVIWSSIANDWVVDAQ